MGQSTLYAFPLQKGQQPNYHSQENKQNIHSLFSFR